MAYKRNIDRLPIIPAGAKEHNVTCHYCIVGCGYKAYTWPLKKQGTTDSNWIGEDLSKQQGAETDQQQGVAASHHCGWKPLARVSMASTLSMPGVACT